MVAHRRLSDRGVGEFRQDAPIQTPRRVALLARGPMVLVQNFVDEGAHHAKLRPGPRRIAVRRGQRTRQRPAHHAAGGTELRGDTPDRADPELMLPTQLLEQIHFGFPVHARSPDSVGATVGLRDRGGPKSISTTGPKFDSRAKPRPLWNRWFPLLAKNSAVPIWRSSSEQGFFRSVLRVDHQRW